MPRRSEGINPCTQTTYLGVVSIFFSVVSVVLFVPSGVCVVLVVVSLLELSVFSQPDINNGRPETTMPTPTVSAQRTIMRSEKRLLLMENSFYLKPVKGETSK